MKEISKVMRVSESRVCQLHMQAIMRLRAALRPYQSDEARDIHETNSGQRVVESVDSPETAAHEIRRSNHQKAIASSGKGRRSRQVIS